MATLTVSLPDDLSAFVESQLALSGHASASDYLVAVLRAEHKSFVRRALQAKLLAGLEGPSVVMDRDDWDSIRREALGMLADEPLRS